MSDDWQETALLQADEVVRLNKEYDKAMSRIAELDAKLRIAVKALEFYASHTTWDWPVTGNEENSMIEKSDCSDVELCDTRGGKLARETLAKLKEVK